MSTALPDRDDVLNAIRTAAETLGRPPSRSEFKSSSGMTEYQVLKHFPSWRDGDPIDVPNFRATYWEKSLDLAKVRYRKLYACRHSHITRMLENGWNTKFVSAYHGTSTQMIDSNYCGDLNDHYDPDKPTKLQNTPTL